MIDRGAKPNPAVRIFRIVWILLFALLAGNAAAGWYDPSWPYRQKITILPTLTDSTLNGFPYLVKITDAANPVFARAQPDGDDLLFTDSTGTFKLNHEIEKYDNSTKELFVWVSVPSISATGNTVIYLYYGHGTASNQENVPDTWDEDFVMVQHLEETSGTHFDSAGANNGNPLGALNQNATGRIDGADLFDGMDDYIDIADSATLQVVEMTLEAWVYMPGSIPSGFRGIVEHAEDTANWYGLWKASSSDTFHFRWSTGAVRRTDFNATVVADTWYYVVGVLDPGATEARTYLNGSPDKTVSDPSLPTPTAGVTRIGLGGPDSVPEWFDGTIDEVRISKVARTGDWIEATFRNLNDPATYQTLDPEQDAASITTLSGVVYEDVDGDSGLGDAEGVAGVRVRLYSDLNDDGAIGAGDSFVVEISTNATGNYSFDVDTVATGTKYLVAIDSKTVPPHGASPFNGGFAQADVWAEQTYGDDPATPLLDLGPRVGGRTRGTSDDVDPVSTLPANNEYQHLARVDVSGGDVTGVHFALSFRVVSHTGDRDDDLSASRTAQGSLRQGVQNANAMAGAATLGVPAGTFVLGLTGSAEDSAGTGDLDVTDDLTLQGQSPAATLIDGDASDRVLDVFAGVGAEVRDLTIRNGDESTGGGVRNAGSLTVRDSTLTANNATEGGAVHNQGNPASLTLDNVVVDGNTATDGAGIYSLDDTSSFSLTDVTLSGNTASGKGGGIYTNDSAATVTASTINGNAANNNKGGGIYIEGNSADLDLTNVTISGNTATSEGGGVFADGNSLSLTHVTVTANSAGSKGGGIRRRGGSVTLRSTIVSNNPGGNCEDTIVSAGYNLDSANTCDFTGPGDQINADAKLGPLQDNGGSTETHGLLSGSDALDVLLAGCPPPATDQRGVTRPVGPGCDTGAFETTANTLSGRVFEDADFAGTASAQGGSDPGLPNVDVELYSSADAYINSTTTDGSGNFSFSITVGTYKVRVRSATIGDDPGGPAETAPAGGFNACVPATCAEPLPEMTWGNGSALYGGQDPAVDDTGTGDNAGPGDTWVNITVSGADVSGVNFGFAYNLIVNTADDALADSARSQQGSLRQFIKNANGIATAGGTTASASQFRVPAGLLDGNGVAAIAMVAALPVVSDASGGTTIDGTTQTINVGDNNASGPEVQIDGAGAGNVDGLVILSAGNTVRGLIVNGFDQALRGGVKITGASATGNTVAGSYIGTDHAGMASMPVRRGVIIDAGAQSNTIGGKTAADRNVIAGNTEFGVFLSGSGTDFNTIEGNFIGADAAGTSPLANQYGVYVTGGPQSNLIGGDTSDERNVISGNTLRGIILVGVGTDSNTISGNHIGIDVNGTAPVPNATGIQIVAAPQSNTIGGTLAGERNVVSGNTSTGIEIGNATLTEIRGNYIGTDVNGTAPLANGLGVSVLAGSTSNTIGGTDTADRNVISGNSLDGIWITGAGTSANTVLGNFIGTDSSGTDPLANGESGIEIKNSASGNTIGGTAAGSDNVISGNTLNGVAIFSSASGNFVLGNFIGTDPGGTLGVGNGTNGVLIFVDATSNTIGGTGPGEANVIGHNGGDGVYVDDAGTDNNSISGNSIFNNGGLGIDLGPDGPGTGNGANQDKTSPTVDSILPIATDFDVSVTVDPGDTLELFRVQNASAPVVGADPTGSGEGFLFLGSCVDDGACSGPHLIDGPDPAPAGSVRVTLQASGVSFGDDLSATATNTSGSTSEFSANAAVTPSLKIVKRAFQSDGTPIASGSTVPKGMPVKFMLYIDNPGGAVADATLQDVLDPPFAYQTGSMKMDNTLVSTVVCPSGVCDEAAIFTRVDGSGSALGDGDADADAGSYSAGTRTIDLGDGNNSNNAQLDLAADRVWAVVFTSRMQ